MPRERRSVGSAENRAAPSMAGVKRNQGWTIDGSLMVRFVNDEFTGFSGAKMDPPKRQQLWAVNLLFFQGWPGKLGEINQLQLSCVISGSSLLRDRCPVGNDQQVTVEFGW